MKKYFIPLYHTIGDLLNLIGRQQKMIYVLGLRRSGNHALINWMLHQQPGLVRFFNNLQIFEAANSAFGRETRFNCNFFKGIEYILQGNTSCYSYEETWLEDLLHLSKLKQDSKQKRHFVIILRDPFNFFASRYGYGIKTAERSPFYLYNHKRRQVVDLWKKHAKFFLIAHSYQWHTINYNLWVSSKDYRKSLADELGLEFSDKGYEEVTSYGKGSSFGDNIIHESSGRAKVLNRWHKFEDDPEFRAIFKDREIWELSDKIFGDISGTKILKNSLQDARS